MAYTNIKTNFVKQELKKTAWKNRDYINKLMDIETFATGNYCSSGAGYIRLILKERDNTSKKSNYFKINSIVYKYFILGKKKFFQL